LDLEADGSDEDESVTAESGSAAAAAAPDGAAVEPESDVQTETAGSAATTATALPAWRLALQAEEDAERKRAYVIGCVCLAPQVSPLLVYILASLSAAVPSLFFETAVCVFGGIVASRLFPAVSYCGKLWRICCKLVFNCVHWVALSFSVLRDTFRCPLRTCIQRMCYANNGKSYLCRSSRRLPRGFDLSCLFAVRVALRNAVRFL
jgi:hypothetical protein